ncbi:MAG: hypothetical protein A3A94_03210 [Candidatus Portnoybacteria bacterium RIFCSPLOWO2_01_FULL_43_11]|uniref:HD/PDEase domain-containing protein n=3 Tax=Candidatus Portnoyibacteriota TaxID=1817913 RepID=A0A1G2FPN1_9BACT|nr:MAG: hypothetical protein A3A94_03210 [Candidatus Portnoybacteria bacterium RIFCSPLOWO2_01_FULL_43_11]OGZ39291.1 MAG: hypothetical protein A3E90_02870 [Candidatus Portnoybacteria bacterium RIFCSPHIGHO2_12_FULL_40_11]OGZ39993.1 MAG: hypothetical protein A3I20_02180 [Candidatus Portnoybacteria bacterium RIFCSPLOWO2_02_FULL_40_15]
MNLRSSLIQSKKPAHQFHDAASLKWIASHRPKNLLNNYTVDVDTIRIIRNLKPWKRCENSWFINNLIKDGIHGFRHVSRVAIHAVFLAIEHYNEISENEIKALMFAALLHDCRRKNDNADPRHGLRAADWLEKKPEIFPKKLHLLSPAIHFAISVHNDPYERIFTYSLYKKFKPFVDILKTADALDRYRFPRSDWWFSSKFITLCPGIKNLSLAFDLVIKSETLFLDTKDNIKSITEALKLLK